MNQLSHPEGQKLAARSNKYTHAFLAAAKSSFSNGGEDFNKTIG